MPIGHRDSKYKGQELSPDQLVAKPSSCCFSLCCMSSLSGASPSRVSASGSPPPGAVGRALLPNVMEAKSALPDSWLQTSPQGGGRFGEITNQRACERWRGGYPEKVREVGG